MFRPKYPDIVKPEYDACCGYHVRKVASVIAILGLLGLIVSIPAAIVKLSAIRLITALVFGLFYAGILYADKYEKPFGYVPFLIAYGFCLIMGIVVIVASLVFIIFPPEMFKKFMDEQRGEEEPSNTATDGTPLNRVSITILLTVIIVLCIIGELIGLYIWNVVRRARKYMIDEVCSGKVERNYTTLESGNPSIEDKY